MSETFRMIAPVKPVGKARPRMTRTGHAYTPKATKQAEQLFARCLKDAMRAQSFKRVDDRALALSIGFTVEIPSSYSKKRREACISDLERPAKKPDIDNLAKLVLDAANGILFKDDAQVIRLVLEKRYGFSPSIELSCRVADV